MAGYRVGAILSLNSPEAGVLALALPSGTPSLIFEFSDGGSVTSLGAIVRTESGEELKSGVTDLVVALEFWADEARNCALPGSEFVIWYGGYVGSGRVDESSPLPEGQAEPNDA